jgi:DeoR/GlpR family transcriptional regulator of sugar metabolism
MNSRQRRAGIHEAILTGGASVDELAQRFAVSPSTIRRDLALLTGEGQLVRTYGGAAPGLLTDEQGVGERERLARPEKAAIARVAADMVSDGDTVLLDAGTTCGALARRLRDRHRLTVITSGLSSVEGLMGAKDVEVILLGGSMRAMTRGTVGPLAELVLRRLTARTVFLSADGVVAGRGLCEANFAQTTLKELMIGQAEDIVVLADASKLGRTASRWWTPLERSWTLITDHSATAEQLAPFQALGTCLVHVVQPVQADLWPVSTGQKSGAAEPSEDLPARLALADDAEEAGR